MTPPVHMLVMPILVPLLAGAIMLMYDERRRRLVPDDVLPDGGDRDLRDQERHAA